MARQRSSHASAGLLVLVCCGATLSGCAAGPTLVDSDGESGFALYRSGRLDEAELTELCRAGVEEILVLTGDAERRECRMRESSCPDLRVRYDLEQSAHTPVGEEFLEAFDAWVEEARREGRKIAFRCRHGWHRTGRLAAYYRIRFQDAEAATAIEEMNRIGHFMWRHRQLEPQVTAMADHLAGRPCSVAPKHCVRPDPSPASPAGPPLFAADACPSTP